MMLEGKVALVTGATRGIGRAVATRFAQEGAKVVVNGRDPKRVEEAVSDLSRYGATGIAADAGAAEEVKRCYAHVLQEHGRLDVLVNNAGILEDNLLGMTTDASVERLFRVNAIGAIHHMQLAARVMARRRAGSIVNVASIVGVQGNAGQVAYASSKAAVVGATLSAAKELVGQGIRVNAVAPGLIDTDMARQVPDAKREETVRRIGMGRMGTPDEVADVILFLGSDLSRYVTGQVIGVDGGLRM